MRKRTIFDIIPELSRIARELKKKLNNREVISEYFRRHPEERRESIFKKFNKNK